VAVNCAAIPPSLFESELFGHVEGAFTGAKRAKRGLVQAAHGGTLFLDEVGEIDLAAQAKLVRFLQERAVTPLGAATPSPVDVRVVAATQVDLEKAVEEGLFRRDLLGRLAVVPIELPPLRERRRDVAPLALAFLARVRPGRRSSFAPEALEALAAFDWPGNVRQLENVVERIAVLNPDADVLPLDAVPDEIRTGAGATGTEAGDARDPGAGSTRFREARDRFEREFLERLFAEARGNVSQAARLAGLSRANLHRKLRQLGIDASRFRE
jgi:DNA-binding NtrC family response regulator